MIKHHDPGLEDRGKWTLWLSVGLALAGCVSSANTRTYEALQRDLRRAGPAGVRRVREDAGDPRGSLMELERLDRESLVRAVLGRNPSVESAREAWRAALAEYPQAVALDDPVVEYSLAPLSVGSNDVSLGQVVAGSQGFPWPGKLSLRGAVALAKAEAARDDYQATRRRLALVASLLFDEYYAVARSIEINEEHLDLAERIKATAQAQYEAGRAPQQDPLQAEVELAHVVHQGIVLEAQQGIIVAQINGLLHRRPDALLPPPPGNLEPDLESPRTSAALQEAALGRRPELAAARAGIEARRAELALAELDYYPDFGVMSSYNSMWMEEEHQFMVGLSINLPIQLGRRRGAVGEAGARLRRAQAELANLADEALVEVERARQHLTETQHVVRLYADRLLPAARAQVEAARVGYESGRNSFQALIDAERSVRTLELSYETALAELAQRRAELQHAVGEVPGLPSEGVAP